MSKLDKILTYKRLGIANLFTVAAYRIAVKIGYFLKIQPIKPIAKNRSNYFKSSKNTNKYTDIKIAELKAFGWIELDTTKVPNWLKAVNSELTVNNNQQHWSKLSDFSLNVGDIKSVWELSRFDWLFHFSLKYLSTQDEENLVRLNSWLNDWCQHNPVNQGVNWKCGQEAAIRVLHLATTSFLLDQEKSLTKILADLIYEHLLRIAPTIPYAMAQDNNHGTSEAAALYIGSLLLAEHDNFKTNANIKKWAKIGKYWLENRAEKLISDDGCFSQNSVNYHRLMLDTLSLSEFFRQLFDQKRFTEKFYFKVKKASQWLFLMTEKTYGKTPILGPNDGANLLPLTNCDYLDFRPSLQWAYSLFYGYFPYNKNADYQQLSTLLPARSIQSSNNIDPNPNSLNSSFHLISNHNNHCYVRTPNLKFRPACCDALHVDFWLADKNILVSTGSYSYNCEEEVQNYFPSVKAHNTAQFDQLEQMPKLSRFLYSQWLDIDVLARSSNSLTAKYQNKTGHYHHRFISLSNNNLSIIDQLSGFKNHVVLRWHLSAEEWKLEGQKLISKGVNIEISADVAIEKIALVEGYQSRYYLKKEVIPVLEVTITTAGQITTSLSW